MFERVNETNFLTIINRFEGYLVNRNSKVESNNRHVVHVLPLRDKCEKSKMRPSKNYPKLYTIDRADIQGLGTQGQVWEFGDCCKERPEAF